MVDQRSTLSSKLSTAGAAISRSGAVGNTAQAKQNRLTALTTARGPRFIFRDPAAASGMRTQQS